MEPLSYSVIILIILSYLKKLMINKFGFYSSITSIEVYKWLNHQVDKAMLYPLVSRIMEHSLKGDQLGG